MDIEKLRDHLDARLGELSGRLDAKFDALHTELTTHAKQVAENTTEIRYLKGFRATTIGLFLAMFTMLAKDFFGFRQ